MATPRDFVRAIKLSNGTDVQQDEVVRAVFIGKGSTISSRTGGPQVLATADMLRIDIIGGGFVAVRGDLARQDGKALEAVGVRVFWSD